MGRHSKTLEELGTCDVLRVDDEELGDSKGFADIELEVRENIFPDTVDAGMSLQETAAFPLLFLFGLFGFTSNLRSTVFSRYIAAPLLSTIFVSSSAWNLF